MDMTNLKNENGFVTVHDLIFRMHRFRPPKGDYYAMRQAIRGSFAEVGVMAYDKEMLVLFKIYAGNEELYNYIKELFERAAKGLGYPCKAQPWRARE